MKLVFPYLSALLLTAGSGWAADTQFTDDGAARIWTRAAAAAEAADPGLDTRLRDWFDLARNDHQGELIQSLAQALQDDSWSRPALERGLYRFALGLEDLPPWSVESETLDWLSSVRMEVLVPHEDHASGVIPMFDTPAAVAGVRNHWARVTASDRAAAMISAAPLADAREDWTRAWLDDYLGSSPQQRAGFLDALADALARAPRSRITEIGAAAAARLAIEPALTPIAASAATSLGDVESLGLVLIDGTGHGIAPALRAAADQLEAADRGWLLRLAVAEAPAETAALTIAVLAPGLSDDAGVPGLLLDLLGDPALGSSAALALSGPAYRHSREALTEVAAGSDLAASRARLAIGMTATQGDLP